MVAADSYVPELTLSASIPMLSKYLAIFIASSKVIPPSTNSSPSILTDIGKFGPHIYLIPPL